MHVTNRKIACPFCGASVDTEKDTLATGEFLAALSTRVVHEEGCTLLYTISKFICDWATAETAKLKATLAAEEKRWPVQSERYGRRHPKSKPAGTVGDAEAREAYAAYARKYGTEQSFAQLHQRGGFGFWELTDFLGHEPKTWKEIEPR